MPPRAVVGLIHDWFAIKRRAAFLELSLKVPANLHAPVTYEAAAGPYDSAALIAGLAP
jgi:hypothetical protein